MIGACLSALSFLLAVILGGQAHAEPRPPDRTLTFACNVLGDCPPRTVPGQADRDVRPFDGTLGRPCTWRERPTPSGPRKVRTCS
ncbi:hypothetical protein [uncultured Methylobacterium sp.]|uniref:hypothetical protein n=1 Tax=uncultured Methylobacterium sp. TaxID=157278 RepID=UPI0035CB8BD8